MPGPQYQAEWRNGRGPCAKLESFSVSPRMFVPADLFHRDGFGEVPRLVNVAATADSNVIGKQLQRDDFD